MDVRGLRYHVRIGGSGKPVLLLHGFPETGRSFRHNVTALLDAGRTVLVPDLKGCGNSDKPLPGSPFGDYRVSTVSLEIADLIAALGYEQVDVVGHDIGGVTLSAMMATAPERIDRAVLLNSICRRLLLHKVGHFCWLNIPWLAEHQFSRDPKGFVLSFLNRWSHRAEAFDEEIVDAYVEDFQRDDSFRCVLGYFRAIMRDVPFYLRVLREPTPRTGSFPPTLVLFGALDPIFPPTMARWAHADIVGSQMVLVEGAGHFVHAEAPDEVNPRIVAFLEDSD